MTSCESLTLPPARTDLGARFAPDVVRALERVVESAVRLAGAACGVLLLTDRDDMTVGSVSFASIDVDAALLAELTGFNALFHTSGTAVRISAEHRGQLRSAPDSQIGELIGVRVDRHEEAAAHLYLANKVGGQFTEADEGVAVALAAGAGVALDNACLVAQEHRRQRWLEATLAMTQSLLGEIDRTTAMHQVTGLIRELTAADYAAAVMVDLERPNGGVVFEAVEGLGLGHLDGSPIPQQGLVARVVESGTPVVSADITSEPGYDPAPEVAEALSVLGAGMYLPLTVSGKVLGVMVVGWRRGSRERRISDQDVTLVEMFAGQAALALQQVQARLLVAEDRDRIATDLRDIVIDRLFAIGTRLHGAAGLVTRPEVQQRMNESIDDLDETTHQIRAAIFALQEESPADQRSATDQLLDEIDAARITLGFTPRLVIHGLVDRRLPPHLQRELVRAVREAVANAATHAAPQVVEVVVQVTSDLLVLHVSDDGRPVGASTRSDPLTRLRTRALRLGGSCDVHVGEEAGTTVDWQVPLAA